MRPAPRPAGFTLIETLAALVIFSVAIIAFIEGMGAATRVQAELVDQARAVMLAQNVMEELLFGGVQEGEDEGVFDPPDDRFAWAGVIESTETEGLLRVAVTLTWTGTTGPRDYTLTTLRHQPVEEGDAF